MEEEKKKTNKWNIVLIIAIAIVAIAIVLEFTIGLSNVKHAIFRLFGIETKEGNTPGNINNYGYAAEDKDYLYFMCPNLNGKYRGINKVSKKDLAGKQIRLIEGEWEITSINSYGDYIYFITLKENGAGSQDEVDNKIHRVKKNGDQKDEVLNDNEFHNYNYKMTVVDGKIYYIGADECIWYMNLDGKNKTKLNDNASGYEVITDKYIIYNMPAFVDGENTSVTYIMDRNGKNAREVNGERLFNSVIYKNYIYYLTEDRYLHRIGIDGKDDIMLSDAIVYNLNVADSGIYYFGEKNDAQGNLESVSLYKMDLDGKNNTKIYTLEEYSNTLCLLKDWVFFLDSSEEEGRMELVSNDGKQKITLFSLRYEDYYYLDEIKERTEAAKEAAVTTETEVDTVPETNDQQ